MKTVLLQIEVPERDFCWEHTPPFRICEHFNNDGGHDTCAFGFLLSKKDKDGVYKPLECKNLEEKIK